MVEKAWWQEWEWNDHITSKVRKQRTINAALFAYSFVFGLVDSSALERCCILLSEQAQFWNGATHN